MKKSLVYLSTISLLAALAFLVGCDFSSGSGDNNFNTRGLASISNVSGVYQARSGGGRVVSNTSNGNITSLNMQQSGNRVEIIDNQGSRYVGTVGNPLLLVPQGTTTIPDGASVASFQISWEGRDGVSAKDIEFTGQITLVSVTDVQGNSTTRTTESDTTTTSTSSLTVTNTVVTTEDTTRTDNQNSTTSRNTEFSLTDSNTQLLLRGTWKEIGGTTSSVDGLAAGIVGNIGFTGGDTGGGEATP